MNYRTQVIIPVLASLGWRWHGEKKRFFMPRCSSAQRSVASA